MRLTDFWLRLEQALGSAYARSWARDFHISALGGLTVNQAIEQGVDTLVIWRAVHEVLDLPEKFR